LGKKRITSNINVIRNSDLRLSKASTNIEFSKAFLSCIELGKDSRPDKELNDLLISYHNNILTTILTIRDILQELNSGVLSLEILEVIKGNERVN